MNTATPIIDLKFALWEKVCGEVTIIGTWRLDTHEPILVLIPTLAKFRNHARMQPCIVSKDTAYRWAEETGDPAWCAQTSIEFARALKLGEFEPRRVMWLTSLIREHIGDLLMMPMFPEHEKQVVAEVIQTDRETGKTKEAKVVGHV